MTDDNGAVASKKKTELKLPSQVDPAIAEQLVAQAREDGVDLVGPGGLLGELTKQVLETGLDDASDVSKGQSRVEDALESMTVGTHARIVQAQLGQPVGVAVFQVAAKQEVQLKYVGDAGIL